MRMVIGVLAALLGCLACEGAQDADTMVAQPLTVTGDAGPGGTCLGGVTHLLLEPDPEIPGRWTGESHDESAPIEGVRHRISSSIQADLIGSVLHVSDQGTLTADTLPEGWIWCSSDLDLVWDEGPDGIQLNGEWDSRDCDCRGKIEATIVEPWN